MAMKGVRKQAVEDGCKTLWIDCEEVLRLVKESIGRALEQSEKRNIASKASAIATALLNIVRLMNERQDPALAAITNELQQGVMTFIRKTKEIFNVAVVDEAACQVVESLAKSKVQDAIRSVVVAVSTSQDHDRAQEQGQIEDKFMNLVNSDTAGAEQQQEMLYASRPVSPRMQEQATASVQQVMKLMKLMTTEGSKTEEVILECKKTLPQLKAMIQRAEELNYGREEQALRAATYNFSVTIKERIEGKRTTEDLTRVATELAEAIRGVMFASPAPAAQSPGARQRGTTQIPSSDKFGTMPNRPMARTPRPTAQDAVQTRSEGIRPDDPRRKTTYHTISPAIAINMAQERNHQGLQQQPRGVRPVSFAPGVRRKIDPSKPLPTEEDEQQRPGTPHPAPTQPAPSTDQTTSSHPSTGTESPTPAPTIPQTQGLPSPLESTSALSFTTRPSAATNGTSSLASDSPTAISNTASSASSAAPTDIPSTPSNQPLKAVGEKVVNKKTVLLSATVSKSIFSPGESMAIEINVNNQTKKVMKKVQMSLVKNAATYSIRKGGEKKLESKNKIVVEKAKVAPGGGFPVKLNKEANEQVVFKLPQDAAPSANDPRATFEVVYFLEVKLLPKGPDVVLGPITIEERK